MPIVKNPSRSMEPKPDTLPMMPHAIPATSAPKPLEPAEKPKKSLYRKTADAVNKGFDVVGSVLDG